MADTIRTLRVELEAGIADFQKQFSGAGKSVDDLGKKFKQLREAEMDAAHGEALKLNESFTTTGKHAGALADTIGKTATTMARSAETFGLPVGPLRALDDVMDVAEIGLGNLSKSAAGFNAASVGVAGAGLAIGTAIGTALRNLTPLGEWLDKYADKLSGLTSVEAAARRESAAALARLQDKRDTSVAPENINATVTGLLKQKDATEKLAKASEILGFQVTELSTAERVLAIVEANSAEGKKKAEASSKKSAEAKAKEVFETKRLAFELDGQAFSLSQAAESLNRYISVTVVGASALPDLTGAVADLNKALGQGPELDPAVIGSQIAAGQRAMDQLQLGERLKTSFKTALADLPAIILAAFEGGGDVGKAIGSHLGGSIGVTLGEELKKKMPGLLGSALGSLAGPLGSILGSLAGQLFDKLSGLFGNKEIMKLNDIRDSFLAANGGWLALQQTLAKGTDEDLVKQIFDAKTVEQFNAAVEKVKAVLASLGETVEPVVVPVTFDIQGGPTGPGPMPGLPPDLPGFAKGTLGSFVNFGDATLAVLHGWERIEPLGGGAGGGDAARAVTIINNNLAVNENPLQTYEGVRRQRAFTVKEFHREASRSLASAVAAGRA